MIDLKYSRRLIRQILFEKHVSRRATMHLIDSNSFLFILIVVINFDLFIFSSFSSLLSLYSSWSGIFKTYSNIDFHHVRTARFYKHSILYLHDISEGRQ